MRNDIQPYVTLYHWDLPLNLLESMGGWVNEDIVVKNWITINEPLQTAVNGYYTGVYAPGRREHSSNEPYLVAHHQLLAHAEAVSIYNKKYKDKQGGQIGLVVDCEWSEALSDRVEDRNATTRRLDFQLGCSFVMQQIREDNDFYRVQEVERIAEWEGGETIGEKAASPWLYMVPWGIWKVLDYISMRYNNPPVYITENGTGQTSAAILHGHCWDNFEWHLGYTKRFGLIYVDYKNGLTRHLKSSAYWFSQFLKAEGGKNLKLD
ncbi:Beta-glucosidase 42 [Sesamum angolense]|uniref:Beta-glucosidase 42 n=1 Tax=Sesamum angolense TaxID=2727404 RepID=A0AAE1T388_9LAMI|nr:Beta-glucosidase 42 [Sesamum angolense]